MGQTGSRDADGGLTKKELDRMLRRFQRLAKGTRKVALADLQNVPELAGNPFITRIFQVHDGDGDGFVTFDEFMRAIESFASLTSDAEKCTFAFRLYDLDGDGFVSLDELYTTLKGLMGRGLSDAQLEEIVESTMMQHDTDGDGRLSLPEFNSLLAASDPGKLDWQAPRVKSMPRS